MTSWSRIAIARQAKRRSLAATYGEMADGHIPSKRELRDMLAEAVRNTAQLSVDQGEVSP